jgi:hypothetical protein
MTPKDDKRTEDAMNVAAYLAERPDLSLPRVWHPFHFRDVLFGAKAGCLAIWLQRRCGCFLYC